MNEDLFPDSPIPTTKKEDPVEKALDMDFAVPSTKRGAIYSDGEWSSAIYEGPLFEDNDDYIDPDDCIEI